MHTDRKGENIMGNTTEARTIYILLTRSGTWFSRLIHLATADSYTHASIGLDGPIGPGAGQKDVDGARLRSEEHTSELQSPS